MLRTLLLAGCLGFCQAALARVPTKEPAAYDPMQAAMHQERVERVKDMIKAGKLAEALAVLESYGFEGSGPHAGEEAERQFQLGRVFFRLKESGKAAAAFGRAFELDAKMHAALYNRACAESLGGLADKSVASLALLMDLPVVRTDAEETRIYLDLLATDDDLERVRKTDGFKALVTRLKARP